MKRLCVHVFFYWDQKSEIGVRAAHNYPKSAFCRNCVQPGSVSKRLGYPHYCKSETEVRAFVLSFCGNKPVNEPVNQFSSQPDGLDVNPDSILQSYSLSNPDSLRPP